ncbi:restriction endonuclease subunit S [Vibrio jasicida]|uniref:restriction endonuclease subunit S n=1 Tax=Vibrio jasicida TaxID=766224 RepID=UPI0011AFE724|nr:restriction endonuclease subunit S [Vibrio jasicida]
MVPNGWMTATLGDLVNKSAFGPRFTSELYAEDGAIGTIRTTDLYNEGEINYATIPYANLDISEYEEHILKEGDLLITRSGTCGIPCIFTEQEKPIIAGAFLIRFQLNNKIESKFLHEVLKYAPIQSDIKRMAAGGVQKNLTGTSLKKLSMPVPPLPEQRKIAQILSTWDRGIVTTEKLIDASKLQKKALMQQLLTGKKRLVDPETGKAFEGDWEEVKLNQIANITMGSSPKSESYNEVGIGLPLLQGNADIKARKSAPRIYTSQITKECNVNDILLSVRAPVGTVAKSLHNACIGRGIASIQAKKNIVQEFVYQWLLAFEPKWERFSQGSTFEAVNSNDIKTLHISLPVFQEQQKIASVLTAADKDIELLEAKLVLFKQEKKALMQQLLTGKRRVKVEHMEEATC